MSEFEPRRFLEALNFAALRHRRQRRKGREGAPYVNHLIEVAHILTAHGLSQPELLCAAVLHDSIEDAGVTLDEIRQRFGDVVAAIVLEVTDDESQPFWQRKLLQVERAPLLSAHAQNLRVADKISNLRGILMSPPANWSLERKLAYYRWAEQVVAGCERASAELLQTFGDVHATGLATLQVQSVIPR